jgi:NinB protein
MPKALAIIYDQTDRDRVINWIKLAPIETRVEIKGPKRTLPQNDRMWAMLTDVATQKEHAGRKYKPDQWKVLFMHACGREVQFIPSLDNSTFIPWGQSSSDLSKQEMTDLIEFMFAWGAENGIVWSDPELVSLLEAAE